MLRRWKQKQGVKATYKQLQEMFEECKRADLVEVIEQLVAGLSEESEATVNVESFFMQACMYNCIKIVVSLCLYIIKHYTALYIILV